MQPSRLQFALLTLATLAWIPATLVRFTWAPLNPIYAAAVILAPLLFLVPKWRVFGIAPPIVIGFLAASNILPVALEPKPHRDELARLTVDHHELILKRQCADTDCALIVEQRRQLFPGIEHRKTLLYAPNHPNPTLVPNSATSARIAPTTHTVTVKPLWPF